MSLSKLVQLYALGFVLCSTSFLALSQSKSQNALIDSTAKAQVFAPGVITTPYTEWSTSFTPDGQTVYSSQGAIYWTIIFSKKQNGNWTRPQVASFSGKWRDTDPFITPDGKKLFFISDRPLEGTPQDKAQASFHIWYVDRLAGDEWGQPKRLDPFINLTGTGGNYAPSVSLKGTLYFCSRDREGHSGMSTYVAEWLGDHYDKPKLILFAGLAEVQDPFIAPDEHYLLFVSGNDLYISFRNHNKGWLAPQKLGAEVNDGNGNSSPYVSADGTMLYYSSNRIKGFFKRNAKDHAVNYDDVIKENESFFNGQPNILMIPIHLPKA